MAARLLALVPILALAACGRTIVPTEPVQVVQPGDNALSCDELLAERQELGRKDFEIRENRRLVRSRELSAILNPYGVIQTDRQADTAQLSVNNRRDVINELMASKGCEGARPVAEDNAAGS